MLNLRQSMRVALAKDSSHKEVAGAAFQWATCGFIFCLIIGALDTGARPEIGIVAGLLSSIIAFCAILLLRIIVVGRT